MSFNEFMGYALPVIMIAAIALSMAISYAIFRHGREKRAETHRQSESRALTGASIVESVRTNNSVPSLEDTFAALNRNLDKRGLKLNTDLRGYATDAE